MAPMSKTIGAVYEFGSFRLDTARRLLMQNDRTLTLPPKTFDLLILLVESRGRVLTKKELMSALWPDTFVEDANLTFQMSAVRKALGPEAGNWIETLPRYGYRFTDKVLEVHPGFTSGGAVPLLTETPAPLHTPAFGKDRRLYYWIPTGLLAIAAAYLAFVHLRESPPLERAVTFQISPPESFATSDVDSIALSPNGDRLLFVGVRPDGGRHYGCGLLIHWRRPHSPALSWSIRRFGRPTAALWRSSQQAN